MCWFCSDIPLSVGVTEPRVHPLQLNTIEFLWDPVKNATVFIQVAPVLSLVSAYHLYLWLQKARIN